MSTENTTKMPIVFIHGLWLHAESWNPWIEFFHEHGYDAIAASWPGDAATTEATRKNADAVAGYHWTFLWRNPGTEPTRS
jgi:non-heme chloroperoxidase